MLTRGYLWPPQKQPLRAWLRLGNGEGRVGAFDWCDWMPLESTYSEPSPHIWIYMVPFVGLRLGPNNFSLSTIFDSHFSDTS